MEASEVIISSFYVLSARTGRGREQGRQEEEEGVEGRKRSRETTTNGERERERERRVREERRERATVALVGNEEAEREREREASNLPWIEEEALQQFTAKKTKKHIPPPKTKKKSGAKNWRRNEREREQEGEKERERERSSSSSFPHWGRERTNEGSQVGGEAEEGQCERDTLEEEEKKDCDHQTFGSTNPSSFLILLSPKRI